jgi:NAD-dependent deacetylase
MEVASLTAFKRDPERFYNWFQPLAHHILKSKPNPAHLAFAQLEKNGHLNTIITQNIDGLHQRAGSEMVLQVHGSLNTLTCIRCYQQVDAEDFASLYIEQGVIPHCKKCNNYLKPDVVLFEEQLPAQVWLKARRVTEACDLMIVAGTSLIVFPVAQLPEQARNQDAKIILVNKTPTYMDEHADVLIQGDVAEIIPAIATEVLHA